MRTEKQIAASRTNGAKSHGPVTPEGKAISSTNALKSGLYAENNVIPGEDPAEFEALVESFHQTYRPVGADQEALVENLIRTKWLLTRLHNIENRLWIQQINVLTQFEDRDPVNGAFCGNIDRFKLLQSRIDSTNRIYVRTRALLLKAQREREFAPQPEESEPVTPPLGSFPQPAPASAPPAPRRQELTPPMGSDDPALDRPGEPATPSLPILPRA